jgi:hypothetical protein
MGNRQFIMNCSVQACLFGICTGLSSLWQNKSKDVMKVEFDALTTLLKPAHFGFGSITGFLIVKSDLKLIFSQL